jgi:hypothetical protein
MKPASFAAPLLLTFCLGCTPAAGPPAPALALPERAAGGAGGTTIAEQIRELDLDAREERIFREVARGNVPSWLRRLEPVELESELDGRLHRVTFWVTPDYLAVGSDEDYFIVPLSPATARRVAALVGGSLPTPRMVDATWASARAKLVPIRIRPDEQRATVRYFERHDRLVQAQARQHRVRPGDFVAGHKVDVVLARAEAGAWEHAVYGWHRSNGRPIQPLFPVAGESAPYFSMGVRLVHRRVLIDGVPADLADLPRDRRLARAVGG